MIIGGKNPVFLSYFTFFSFLCKSLSVAIVDCRWMDEDDITRRRLLTLVFGCFEPRKFKLINQKPVRS